ncbi:glycosyltransferase family protein [Pseudactinotalea sp. Z1739]|uniref:glycosyltransferase family protein n=1 Tax=Pseudactinotalea sp. Z1739 TaxID=3413028 RepID=UPI003C7B0530
MDRARKAVDLTVAWFSDDPVHYKSVYADSAPAYNIVLHTGGVGTLEVYRESLGLRNGVQFPFWTDNIEHPFNGEATEKCFDILFLGNVHDEVRRDRQEYLSALGERVAHFGKPSREAGSQHRGIIESLQELHAVARRSRFGLNFAQRFYQYRNSPNWSIALERSGHFSFTSRLVQYLAMGLPVMTRDIDALGRSVVPEVLEAQSAARARAIADDMDEADRLNLAQQSHQRQRSAFHAANRARFLQQLVENDRWRRWSLDDRAEAFQNFSQEVSDRQPSRFRRAKYKVKLMARSKPLVVGLTGTGWANPSSLLKWTNDALSATRTDVIQINPFHFPHLIRSDLQGHFRGIIDLSRDRHAKRLDTIISVGGEYLITSTGASLPPVLSLWERSEYSSRRVERLAQHSNALIISSSALAEELANLGYFNTIVASNVYTKYSEPVSVDKPAQRAVVRVIADRFRDIELAAPWILDEMFQDEVVIDLDGNDAEQSAPEGHTVNAVLLVPDMTGPVPRSPLHGLALQSPALQFAPRMSTVRTDTIENGPFITVGGIAELEYKMLLYTRDRRLMLDYLTRLQSHEEAYSVSSVIGAWLQETQTQNTGRMTRRMRNWGRK